MMNTELLPNTTAADTAGAFAIIALIADPQAAKARLDELNKAAADAAQALADAKSLSIENDKRAADLVTAQDALQADRAALDRMAQKFSEETARRNSELAEREAAVGGRETAAHEAEQENERVQVSFSAREARIAEQETALSEREQAMTAREADYDARIARLKALAG